MPAPLHRDVSTKGRLSMRRQDTLSLYGKAKAKIATRLSSGSEADFKSIKLDEDLQFNAFKDQVDMLFATERSPDWRVETLDGSTQVTSSDSLLQAYLAYQESESSRRRDVLEAKLEEIRSALSSPSRDIAVHARACHGLWELARDATNHKCACVLRPSLPVLLHALAPSRTSPIPHTCSRVPPLTNPPLTNPPLTHPPTTTTSRLPAQMWPSPCLTI